MPAPLQRRYLSLWLRRLATDRLAASGLARSRSGGPDEPLVITRLIKSALRIVAMDDAAHRLGLRVGMPLADARAMYPALAVATSDKEADRRLLEGVADWCDRYTPLVGLDAPDGLMLDIAGCAHLFGGETAMGRDMLKRLAAQGLQARAAIADTPGAASAVARFGGASVVPPGALRQALAPLPVAALRLSPDTAESLAELGLKHIADLIDLPRAPLAARFGEGLVRRLDQALGREDEPITPRLPVPSYVAEQRFPDPIGLERDVLGVITRLAARLGTAMERRQDGARLLQVALFRTDNKVYRIEVGTGAPVRDAARIARLFADRLATVGDACDPGFGFDMVRLAAVAVERSEPMQPGLREANTSCHLSPAKPERQPEPSEVVSPEMAASAPSETRARDCVGCAQAPAQAYGIGPQTDRAVRTGGVEGAHGATGRYVPSWPEQAPLRTLPRRPARLFRSSLPSGGFGDDGWDDEAEFSHLIDRLGARFGLHRVVRLVAQDTHIPEFAVMAMPAHAVSAGNYITQS